MTEILLDEHLASGIRRELLFWYDRNRRDLPWRRETDPYRIWLSEIMLQQTRVEAVIPYYHRFLEAFPDLSVLAGADEDRVLKLWEGLGYYSRARNFLNAVREVAMKYGGSVPAEADVFGKLSGVGEYTTAAVCSIAFQKPLAVVDGNVRRVLCRLFFIEGDPRKKPAKQEIDRLAGQLLDQSRPGDFNQAVMELGAMVCIPRVPRCSGCPLVEFCCGHAFGKAESLPFRTVKRSLPTKTMSAAVVIIDGKCLVRRRIQPGLLAGLWEFPAIDDESDVKTVPDRFGDLLCMYIESMEKMADLTHTFSHLHWEVAVWFCKGKRSTLPTGDGWRWVEAGEMTTLAFPKIYHPVVTQVLQMLMQS